MREKVTESSQRPPFVSLKQSDLTETTTLAPTRGILGKGEAQQDKTREVTQRGVVVVPPRTTETNSTSPLQINNDYNTLSLQVPCTVGGRLGQFWEHWANLGAKMEVVQMLKEGLKWSFTQKPHLRNSPWRAQNFMGTQKRLKMEEAIAGLLRKNAIEKVHQENSPGYYSILFLREKPSGEMRPIIDLKQLNKLIINHHFQMESARSIQLALTQGEWCCRLDLQDAYFHIPINQNYKKYLRFSVNKQTYQFKALPFGLIVAPKVFTAVMKEVVTLLRKKGIMIHMYLDDWLIRHTNRNTVEAQTQEVLHLCQHLGLIINEKKSQLVASQIFDFVAVHYNLRTALTFAPERRLEKLTEKLQKKSYRTLCPARKQK